MRVAYQTHPNFMPRPMFQLHKTEKSTRAPQTHVSLGGIIDGHVKSILRDPLGLGGNPDPPAVERLHGDLEAHPGLADEVPGGDDGVLEDDVGRGAGADAELVLLLAVGDALRLREGHDEGRDALVLQRLVSRGEDNDAGGCR